jgi:hypothetical protein
LDKYSFNLLLEQQVFFKNKGCLAGLYIDGSQAAGLELFLEIPRLIAYFLNYYFIKINNVLLPTVGWTKVSKSIGIVVGGAGGSPLRQLEASFCASANHRRVTPPRKQPPPHALPSQAYYLSTSLTRI